jgi:predicted kinase
MKAPVVVVITGIPCTGKTTLGRRIAAEFSLPLVTKDGIKEVLFDSLGWKDRHRSRKFSLTSFDLILHIMDLLLQAGCSHIVEGNFTAEEYADRLLDLQRRHPFRPFQILCIADDHVIRQRLEERAMLGLRHPGHLDRTLLTELEPRISGERKTSLDIGDVLMEVDTTDPATTDSQAVVSAIRAFMDGNG